MKDRNLTHANVCIVLLIGDERINENSDLGHDDFDELASSSLSGPQSDQPVFNTPAPAVIK